MKIKTKEMSYTEVIALPKRKKFKPKKPSILFRTLLKVVSDPELKKVGFECNKIGMQKLKRKEPCIILMNHSSFIDLKIAASVLYPRPFNIVCTFDGFVGKNWLMRNLGCIPTNKFVFDFSLLRSIQHTLKDKKSSVLMYPEACYSFDGTSTTLGDNLGKFLKMMGVPLVMIKTYGAFTRDPLYNNLQKRNVKVSADMEYVLSPEEIAQSSAEELQKRVEKLFEFDAFRWQEENGISIPESFRADGLHRVLYKCPDCMTEGQMQGLGTAITCKKCGASHELTKSGTLSPINGAKGFKYVSDWYRWERECVKKEIEEGRYGFDLDVDIAMLVNTKCLYKVGSGRLKHGEEGFSLCGCDGMLNYSQKPLATYTLNSDFFWYEMGDVIAIGDNDTLYYCFPKDCGDVVAKARLATEELFKLKKVRVHANA